MEKLKDIQDRLLTLAEGESSQSMENKLLELVRMLDQAINELEQHITPINAELELFSTTSRMLTIERPGRYHFE